jgi:acetyltransferase-like isoleucine patch superfamily enzyme
MRLVTKIVGRIIKELYFFKVSVMQKLFGIDYVSQQLLLCPRIFIGDLLKRHGASIGNGVNFKNNICIDNASGDEDATGDFSNLIIGNKCYIGNGVFFDLPDKIVIEDECAISAGVKFITHSDSGGRIMSKWYPRRRGRILIGYGSWIGVNAVIKNGVVLGKCCVVAAGTIVTKSFPDYSVIAGMPGKIKKTLPQLENKCEESN